MKAIWRRKGNIAEPVGDESLAALHAHKDGAEFTADTKAARNLDQLKMFWALATIVADNRADVATKEVAKMNILRALGYVDIWFDVNGQMQTETQSIAFENMEQAVFDEFFKRAIDLVIDWLASAPEAVRQKVFEIVGEKGYSR